MNFFDCNAFIGLPVRRGLYPPAPAAQDILAEMDFCGVERALVWHIAQFDASPQTGNALLTAAIQPHPRLLGGWSILPNQAHEFPPFETFLEAMRQARVVALRVFPNDHHFLLNAVAMGSWLEPMVAHRVPLFLSVERGANWPIVYNLLAEFPDLVCVICDHGCWGEDRRFRPLIECYPHVYVDTSQYLLDGGIEAFAADYGPGRMLFGSGFPVSYLGGMMLALRHARIDEEAKAAIAGKNLEQMLAEVR
jgi:predicted TIM-barrel fold metal-dependent hydrolase